jgi:uncharacterized protein with HEPN domain
MSKRDDRISLRDMLSHAREAIELLGTASQEELQQDRVMQLALTRLIEIVGEAANRVSPETRHKHSKIPWPQIIGMRNRLVHGYDVVDLNLLWGTVNYDLPPLLRELQQIVK